MCDFYSMFSKKSSEFYNDYQPKSAELPQKEQKLNRQNTNSRNMLFKTALNECPVSPGLRSESRLNASDNIQSIVN